MLDLGERLGSGDGERKTLLTRQIAFEPLPASVLFGLVWGGGHVPSLYISRAIPQEARICDSEGGIMTARRPSENLTVM